MCRGHVGQQKRGRDTCVSGAAAAGQRERRGGAAQGREEREECLGRRTQEGQPRAEAGRDRDAPEFTLEIKLFPNKSLYAETFDDCQFVKNLWLLPERNVYIYKRTLTGLPWCLRGKESTCHAGDPGSIPGSRRSPGGGHGHPLQYSCLENPKDRGAWQATVHGVAEGRTRLSS